MQQPIWSEEELRWITPKPASRPTGARSLAQGLRAELSARNVERARGQRHELTRGSAPSVIYAPASGTHGNFIDASYRNILAHPVWAARLTKAHTGKRRARPTGPDEEVRAWRELDTATSSDALLMNIFCYPRLWASGSLAALLGVSKQGRDSVEFGVRASAPLLRRYVNTTEIDMRLGDLLVEAKLTETDFQFGTMRMLERYRDLATVFDVEKLEVTARGVRNYQLIRGVLAAHAANARFCVFCDARRSDLVAAWFAVIAATRSFELQARLQLVTWQEIAACVPKPLQAFLADKYGIQ